MRNPLWVIRFIGGRIVRSFISLLLFQIILFSIIQGIQPPQAAPVPAPEPEIEIDYAKFGEVPPPVEDEPAPSEEVAEPSQLLLGWQQYTEWAGGFFRGDLGTSVDLARGSVSGILAAKLPRTLLLLIPGTVLGFLIGIWIGSRIAWGHRSWLEFLLTLGGTAFYTAFPPWLAFVLVMVFAVNLQWFPLEKLINANVWLGQEITLDQIIIRMLLTLLIAVLVYIVFMWVIRSRIRRIPQVALLGAIGIAVITVLPWVLGEHRLLVSDIAYHLVLPLAALILLSFGESMLVMKTIMTETLLAPYITVARAKGLAQGRVRDHHASRVAILPALSRFVIQIPYIIMGSIVIELIFAWDGMGQELLRAADENDFPVLLGILSLVGVGILLMHLLLDFLTITLDPRLRDPYKAQLQ